MCRALFTEACRWLQGQKGEVEMSRGYQRDVGSRLRTTSMAENSGNRPAPSAAGLRVTREFGCASRTHASVSSVEVNRAYFTAV